MSAKLGEILLRENIINPQQLRESLDVQRKSGGRLSSNLIRLGYISEEDVLKVFSREYGVRIIKLDSYDIDPTLFKLIPVEVAMKHAIVPIEKRGTLLTIATSDPSNIVASDDIKFMTGLNVEMAVASESAIWEALNKHYGVTKAIEIAPQIGKDALSKTNGSLRNGQATAPPEEKLSKQELEDVSLDQFEFAPPAESELSVVAPDNEEIDLAALARESEDAPIVRLVNVLLVDALRREASDIHVEPYEKELRIRFRIDGLLYEVMHPPLRVRDPLISRLKIMAKLDISERRLPQDGRIKIKVKVDNRSRELDFRVSTLPTLFGEKVVLRLLDKENLMLDMTRLGFEPRSLEMFQRNISKPYGMVLVTGPTGSGKTNTLYSALQSLNTADTNIMTAEDPIEFNLKGINQVQMKEQIGLNFAAALRSFLRQDPNIILVGEIRDFETAEIAIKAALTGHLVLSTLHTNDAPSTISRLVNMGIEPFLVATSINLIQAQRLIRRICNNCKEEIHVPVPGLVEIGFSEEEAAELKVYRGRGCAQCNDTGYKGRVGLYEVMEVTEEMRELIIIGASAIELRKKATESGMLSLRESGLYKLREGITTIEEVVKETVL